MNILFKTTFSFFIAIALFSSCKNNEHGCIDSNATNYNSDAVIDNSSCCYDCYYGENNLFFGIVGEYCGNEVSLIENDTHDIIAHRHVNSAGETVFPATPGAIGVFDPGTGQPEMITYQLEITCGISPDIVK